jgi:MFS-type transporter involved in bile tolerance (Atg22 family)
MKSTENTKIQAPMAPILVMIIAILLPGMGQVCNNTPQRGFFMVTFMIILGLITFNLAQPHISMIGKLAGGIFIYALSIMDAYYWAKYRSERFKAN